MPSPVRRTHTKGYLGAIGMSAIIICIVHFLIQAENRRLSAALELTIQPWKVTYFEGKELQGEPIISGYDDRIDFNWKGEDPVEGVSGGRFSATWETCALIKNEQEVYFYINADDGIRILVDGDIVFESWKDQVLEQKIISHRFSKGEHYLRVEYYQTGGPSQLRLAAGAHKKMIDHIPVDHEVGKTKDFIGKNPCSGTFAKATS